MKKLLIILSLLLLPSLLIGEGNGVLYQYETSSGLVWKTFDDEGTNPKYKGEIKNREPNGQGTITYPDGRKYVGEWSGGTWNGQGKYTFEDGFGYEGEWKNGNENGIGNLTYPNGDKYIGEFKNGKMRDGKMYKKNGDIHIQKNSEWILMWGVMYFGLRNGVLGYYKGKWDLIESEHNKDYSKYEGEIKDGKPNGKGTETSTNRGKYIGEFKNGKWINGEYFNKDGKIGVKYINGKMIKQ